MCGPSDSHSCPFETVIKPFADVISFELLTSECGDICS